MPVRFLLFLITVEVVTACEEEVEGAGTHEIDVLGPHTSSVACSVRSVSSTGQDIDCKAQPVISQADGMTAIWLCCHISKRLFCSVTGSGGSDISKINIHQSRSLSDVSHTANNKPCQAEAPTRTCFLAIQL